MTLGHPDKRPAAPSGDGENLLIFPCNGNGMEALDCIAGAYRFSGFVDDTPEKQGATRHGHAVFNRDALYRVPFTRVLAVPGSPISYPHRSGLINSLGISKERFATVIHPRASVSPMATIGYNVLIMAGVVITSNAVIGNHVCILPNTVIHHDAVVGDWSLIGSNVTVAGEVWIGENCYVASGSSIMNGVRLGNRSLVGLGSTVIRNVPGSTVVAGSPARGISINN